MMAAPAAGPKAAVRSAEKDRVATCAFADRVAACVLEAYRLHAADFDAERCSAGRQTVVAGICALDSASDPPALACVSWGCGTKFVRRELVEADVRGARVRDGHAEVLARRGLLDALYAELEESAPGAPAELEGSSPGAAATFAAPAPPASPSVGAQAAAATPAAGVGAGSRSGATADAARAPPAQLLRARGVRLLEPAAAPAPGGGAPCWRLRRGVTLHLYSSSQPCGNASMKRWAKGKAEAAHAALGDHEWPEGLARHERQHWPQLAAGQVATLVKKEEGAPGGSAGAGSEEEAGEGGAAMGDARLAAEDDAAEAALGIGTGLGLDIDASRGPSATAASSAPAAAAEAQLIFHPPGTAPAGAHAGRTHTCSDKVCRWQCLGLQGGLLAHLLPEPLAVHTVTVGRKFQRACLERALCCRAQHFEPRPPPTDEPAAKQRRRGGRPRLLPPEGYRVRHAAMLCTALKLDPNTAISTAATDTPHASFSDPRVIWWSAAAPRPEVLDGLTGLPLAEPVACVDASMPARADGAAALPPFAPAAAAEAAPAVARAAALPPASCELEPSSRVSSASLLARFVALCERTGRHALVADRASLPGSAKAACAPYTQAREALLTDPRHLGAWQFKQ